MRVNASLFTGLVLGILATTVLSQNSEGNGTPGTNTGTPAPVSTPSSRSTSPPAPTTSASTLSALPPLNPNTLISQDSTSASSTRPTPPSSAVVTGGIPATMTGSVPNISPTSKPPPLPSLTETNGAVPFPIVTVPPTANAPFMQKSSLPEGTVFIAVGSALAFFALAVISWRGLVAWSLHRSVKRAATHVNISDTKKNPMMRPPPKGGSGGFYAVGPGSQLSLDHLATTPRTSTRPDNRQMPPSTNLFFSPTAGTSATSGDRRSSYLPAGYYASGSRDSQVMMQPPANTSHTHLHSQSVSSTRYGGRNVGISPPGSPLIGPSGPAVRGSSSHGQGYSAAPQLRASESHTSLALPPTGAVRAPSAYLEDLFESHRQQPGQQHGQQHGRY